MLIDLRNINFEDERDDPLLAQEANEAAGEFEMKAADPIIVTKPGMDGPIRYIAHSAAHHEPVSEETAIALECSRWERKALKSLKRFHTAAVKFESDAIPPSEQARIREALESAMTADEVKAVFQGKLTPEQREAVAERVGDIGVSKAVLDERIDAEWDAAMEWAKQVVE